MGQDASPPPRQWSQPLEGHPPALQWPSQGYGSAPQPAHRYGGQNALGWANERADDASAQLLIELHMVAD